MKTMQLADKILGGGAIRSFGPGQESNVDELIDQLFEAWIDRDPHLVLLRQRAWFTDGVYEVEVVVQSGSGNVERILFCTTAGRTVGLSERPRGQTWLDWGDAPGDPLPVAASTASSDLVLQADGSAFELAGQAFSIKKHVAMRRILVHLVEQHLSSPGRSLGVEILAAAGWPGERIRQDAARNRVKVAVAGLRKHGLRDVLVHDGTGYSLRADLDVALRSAPRDLV